MDEEPQWARLFYFFFNPRQSLRIHYFVGFGSAFTKVPPVGGYGYAVILDDDLRIVASPSSQLNILEKPLFFVKWFNLEQRLLDLI